MGSLPVKKLVVGLGNPGAEYEETRHNIGATVVKEYAHRRFIALTARRFASFVGEDGDLKTCFLLPQTYMNRSGIAVKEAVTSLGVDLKDLMVVHDDIDLLPGRLKCDFDAGPAGHRGVLSIQEEIGSREFYRIRLGIGRPNVRQEVEEYVLSPFSSEEQPTVQSMCDEGGQMLEQWILQDPGPTGR